MTLMGNCGFCGEPVTILRDKGVRVMGQNPLTECMVGTVSTGAGITSVSVHTKVKAADILNNPNALVLCSLKCAIAWSERELATVTVVEVMGVQEPKEEPLAFDVESTPRLNSIQQALQARHDVIQKKAMDQGKLAQWMAESMRGMDNL